MRPTTNIRSENEAHLQALTRRLEQATRLNAQWQELFDGIADPIFIHDRDFIVVRANRAYAERAGMAPAEVLGRPYWEAFPRRDGPLPDCARALHEKRDHSGDQFTLADGSVFRSRAFAIYDAERRHKLSVHILEDVSEWVAMERSLRESEHKFRLVTESIRDVFWLGSPDGSRIDYISPACERIWGVRQEDVYRDPALLLERIHPDDGPGVRRANAAGPRGDTSKLQYRVQRPDGSEAWVQERRYPASDGNSPLVAAVVTDISAQHRYQEQLYHQSTHDDLTGLPNRTLVRDRLAQAVARARRHGHMVAVLFIDLDRFKVINDSLGHSAGDSLLRVMADRLRACTREGDTVARQGGDEFVVLLGEVEDTNQVVVTARRILDAVLPPVEWQGQTLHVTTSIGISLFPRDGVDTEVLLRNADAAMYQAKEGGRNAFTFFTAELNARLLERLTLETQLRDAIARDELVLHYQPQLDLNTGYVTGVEALLRWQHPRHGLLAPAHFIAIAEESNLIVPIGEWVVHRACRQMLEWQRQGLPPMVVAVNVSVQQMREPGFADRVVAILAETGLEPKYLELELTESLLVENSEHVLRELTLLRTHGVRLALDDFGTGYSSLAYLQRYPFDSLKVDRSFVRDVVTDPDNATITRMIIAMAHALGLKVIGEGVESESQAQYLRRNFCDQMQGFLYSKALPATDLAALLTATDRYRKAQKAEPGREQRTLLIVDDEPNVARALRRLLRKEGYHIVIAESARDGFEQLALYGAAVIISDQRMPDMTGIEFLARVKDIHPECMRLLLTAYPDIDVATRAVNSGAVYKFLSKPWQEEALAGAVREAFRHYQRRAQNGRCS